MDFEAITHIAQEISFAYEDYFNDEEKRNHFLDLFHKYLTDVDPAGAMEPYDAIIMLGRKNPVEFNEMIGEMKRLSLIKG